jgi:hypothetical protein
MQYISIAFLQLMVAISIFPVEKYDDLWYNQINLKKGE